ncbi:MAG: hypothetical protein ACTSVU_08545 [Promethearchaeota archaeon]
MVKDIIEIKKFEAVRVHGELFGKAIEFNRLKHQIKFSSEFHDPGYIPFTQIESVRIWYDEKKLLFWAAICTVLLFVGVFFWIIRIALPPWVIELKLKKTEKPIKIRARIHPAIAISLSELCTPEFPTVLKIPPKVMKKLFGKS